MKWPARIEDQLNLQNGIVSLLMWDNDLFANMVLPDGVDSNTVIDNIVMKYGKKPLDHPDPEYMKNYIGVWSRIRKPIWEKLLETLNYDYNPIHNYDRQEEYTDTRTVSRDISEDSSQTNTGTQTETTKTEGSTSNEGSTENQVSAYNASTYQPNEKNVSSDSGTNTVDGSLDRNTEDSMTGTKKTDDDTNETFTHTAHLFGNIGVTTTQTMIKEQRDVVNYSIYDVIASDFCNQFCLDVY